ncbi:acyl carrier protein [Dickeya dianthicola]|uniref:acyl carrier protein n=1 Tax=Dickeya dianthicola TaxID=204039 RepID=UPI0018668180|nr:acyl carrier protein [Dickeya dianthicola]MCI4185722.1 acyl carrier protein [Dickeya dianthicola]QOL15172.1 acyl carrier protein [Dickeya dianthicola]
MNELDEALSGYLVALAAKILKCEQANIEWESDIDEYGFESMEVNQYCADLNTFFSIKLTPVVFLEVNSLQGLSEYLKKHHFNNLETALL